MPKRPPMSDLIAQTPGAQGNDEARRSISRRKNSRVVQEPPREEFAATEPNPVGDTEAFARGFYGRLMEKDTPPPRGTKPKLVTNNDDADPDKTK